MKKFTILCLFAIALMNSASARVVRDVSLGYDYLPGHTNSGGSDVLLTPNTVADNTQFTQGLTSTNSYSPQPSGGAYLHEDHSHYSNIHQAPIVTKHFYIHSAPEDHDEQQIVRYVNVGRPQQDYRVVFIKAPTSSVSRAKIIANVAPVEDKTAIYVLAKKSNALDVSAEVVTQRPLHHKPEVFFVKYKTPEEAEHAQHVIQAQYNRYGGTSEVSNEGVIPVSSVIGSLGTEAVVNDAVSSISETNVGNTGTAYLPAQQK